MRGSYVTEMNFYLFIFFSIIPEDQINTLSIMGKISQNKPLYWIRNLQYYVVVTLIIQLQLFHVMFYSFMFALVKMFRYISPLL